MPKNTRVYRCKKHLMAKGMPEGQAIATCQKSTKQNYMTGKKITGKTKGKTVRKA